MKRIALFFALLFAGGAAFAQNAWTLDPGHSRIGFTVTHHMISEVDGYFRTFSGKMTTTKDDFSDAVFELTVQTASLNTENEMRDGHLKSADVFDVEKFPTMTFKTIAFAQIAGNRYKMTGDLTIKGVTKPISMDVTLVGPGKNERAKRFEIGVKGLGKLSRLAYGVGERLDTFSVSDEVELRIVGEFDKGY
ncbi:MAG: YceI family protein [Bacteroidota bacterium]